MGSIAGDCCLGCVSDFREWHSNQIPEIKRQVDAIDSRISSAERGFGKPAQTANIGGDCERCASFDAEVPDPVEQLEEKLSSMRERMFPDLPPDQCACDPCYQAYKDSLVENSNSSTKSPDCVLTPIRSHLI